MVELISLTEINWKYIKQSFASANIFIDQCPVSISKDAQYLLYLSLLMDIDISNPFYVLRHINHRCMEHLHYTFSIICSPDIWEEFLTITKLCCVSRTMDNGNKYIIATGSLALWYNLMFQDTSTELRKILNTIVLIFGQRGLSYIFPHKKSLKDGTFLLC
jgi:hypothetical protein